MSRGGRKGGFYTRPVALYPKALCPEKLLASEKKCRMYKFRAIFFECDYLRKIIELLVAFLYIIQFGKIYRSVELLVRHESRNPRMAIPEIGSIQNFYCDCLGSERKESYRDSYSRSEERTVKQNGPLSTAWVCKARFLKQISTGVFSTASTWMYYLQCMNCGKTRDIGVWDSNGNNYGDGRHLGR